MTQEKYKNFSRSTNLILLLVALPAGIFLSEVVAMLIVQFHKGPYSITILVDALITTTLVFPLIFLLSFRPLLKQIAEQEQAESIMEVRLRLIQFAVSHSVDELLQATLDEIEVLTGSSIGFFHFLDSDQETLWLQSWSTNTLQNMCKAEGKGSHYSVNQAGVWADCVRERRTIVHNDYPSLAQRKGTPEGHAPIIRELTVPIMRDGQVVAILGIGNKLQAYTASDVDLVSTIADFAWDIIDRKRAEHALRESEQKFRTLVDWTYDWEKWIDPQGNIVYTSPSCERITGCRPEEFISNPHLLSDIVHPDDRKCYEEHKQLLHDEQANISGIEYRIIARDGSEHWIEHICRPLFGKDDRYLGRRVSSRDITLRKLAEQEILERNQKEIMLTQALHNMQLEIARDLHDTVGQNIGYLRMRLDYLSETNLKPKMDMRTEVTNMLEVANESYELIRGTLAVLQSGGLADPLTLFIQYAHQIEERSPFKVGVASRGEPRPLSPAQVRQLFFVFREALSNIEKHADASQVAVEFDWVDDCLTLMITDDGHGFRPENAAIGGHYGLKFMQERITSLHGTFSIRPTNGKGTTIKITLPYEQTIESKVAV